VARQAALPFSCVHSVSRVPRLSARHGGVFQRPGRAFGGYWPSRRTLRRDPFGHRAIPGIGQSQGLRTVSQLLAGGLSVPERSPGTARAREVRFPTPAGAAPCSTILTPHDSALDKQDKELLILGINAVKGVLDYFPVRLLTLSPCGRGCRAASAARRVRGNFRALHPLTRLALRFRSARSTLSHKGRG
jgi:hypothetical protein